MDEIESSLIGIIRGRVKDLLDVGEISQELCDHILKGTPKIGGGTCKFPCKGCALTNYNKEECMWSREFVTSNAYFLLDQFDHPIHNITFDCKAFVKKEE